MAQKSTALFAPLYERLHNYPLRPYLQAERLRQRLPDEREQAKVFLARYGNAPMTQPLRSALLRFFAKDGAWSEWLEHYRGSKADAQRCRHAHALWQTGRVKEAASRTQALWLNGKSMPDECDAPFSRWRQAGGISNPLTLARIALAVRAGNPPLARYLGKKLPPEERTLMKAWLRLRDNPKSVAELPLIRYPAQTEDMVAYALRRLARTDAVEAARFWREERTRRPYPPVAVKRADEWVGLFLAGAQRPEAVDWLSGIREPIRDQVRYWRVTSALRHGRWPAARQALGRLPAQELKEPRWQYWQGRAAEHAGQVQLARQAYARAASARSFHGFLAADRLGRPYSLNPQPQAPSAAAIKRLSNQPSANRAREWLAMERYTEARREWHYLLGQLEGAKDLIAAAHAAHGWGWHSMAIVTLGRAKALDFISLRFPLPYQTIVRKEAKRAGVSALWARAVMRQESAYLNDIRSSAGALGLMQLLPGTAREVAQSLGMRLRHNAELFSPVLNIKFGTTYLARLSKRLNGHTALATAAYNAGPHRIRRWRAQSTLLDGDIWVETIPFKETRRYVRAVLAYQAIYGLTHGANHGIRGRYPSFRVSEALTPVAPYE